MSVFDYDIANLQQTQQQSTVKDRAATLARFLSPFSSIPSSILLMIEILHYLRDPELWEL